MISVATRRPAIEVPTHYACNKCNDVRSAGVHPCPKCRCPEYRIETQPLASPLGEFHQVLLWDLIDDIKPEESA